jgi:hypothetical protein
MYLSATVAATVPAQLRLPGAVAVGLPVQPGAAGRRPASPAARPSRFGRPSGRYASRSPPTGQYRCGPTVPRSGRRLGHVLGAEGGMDDDAAGDLGVGEQSVNSARSSGSQGRSSSRAVWISVARQAQEDIPEPSRQWAGVGWVMGGELRSWPSWPTSSCPIGCGSASSRCCHPRPPTRAVAPPHRARPARCSAAGGGP